MKTLARLCVRVRERVCVTAIVRLDLFISLRNAARRERLADLCALVPMTGRLHSLRP